MPVTFGLGSPSLLPTLGLGVSTTPAAGEFSFLVDLRQDVLVTDEYRPLVGSHAVRLDETSFPIKGFHFDRKRYIDQTDIRTINPGTIGNITDRYTDGSVLEHWQSGIGFDDDCKVIKLVKNQSDNSYKWSPLVFHGEYHCNVDNFFLLGDGYVHHPLITGFTDLDISVSPIALEYTPDSNAPIVAGIYRRERDGSASPWRVASLVNSLTGVITEPGERASTAQEDGTPDYSLVDDFLRWEICYHADSNAVYFNKNMARLFGTLTPTSMDELELVGTSDGSSSQRFYTRYFPVDPGTSLYPNAKHVVYVNGIMWDVADGNDLSLHNESTNVYEIDYDLGMLTFGRAGIDEDFYLEEDISDAVTEIALVGDLSLLPARGTVLIDSEKIAYLGKTSTHLVQCIRGYAGSTAVSHIANTLTAHQGAGAIPASGAEIRVGYHTTPRIEYLSLKQTDKTVADDVNARPSNVPEGNGIVYISRKPLALSSLVLSVDKPLISGSTYGPLNVGADYALLTATAYDSDENPVARIPVTIDEITSPPFIGYLNGAPDAFVAPTNYSGFINAGFVVGGDMSTVFLAAESITSLSGQTAVTVAGNYDYIDVDEIFIYVVTKDDPAQGTVGVLANYQPGSLSVSSLLPNSFQKLTVTTMKDALSVNLTDIYPDDVFNGGTLTIYTTSNTAFSATIKYWRDGTVYIDQTLPVVDADIDFVVLNKPNWQTWNPSTLNGRKRVLYTYNVNAINPITNLLGAYFPVQPSSKSYDTSTNQTTFIFDLTLPSADPTDVENNVGGYMLTIPRLVSFRASAIDPFSGRPILSNTISVRIYIPDYLNGIYLNNNGKIPYGFRIRDDIVDASTGIDGVTFVTINPVAGSYGAVANPFASLIHMISV